MVAWLSTASTYTALVYDGKDPGSVFRFKRSYFRVFNLLLIIFAIACSRLTPMTVIPKTMHKYAGILAFREALLSLI